MRTYRRIIASVALAVAIFAPQSVFVARAQETQDNAQKAQKPKPESDGKKPLPTAARERMESDDKSVSPADVPADLLANRRQQMNEEAESEIPSYNNFLSSYRLGPEDVISISVFGLDRYSKSGITVPPDGRVDYYFVKGGLFVVGKSTREVADDITKHLDEYIIDPKVTVSLDKAMSQRYGIIGDVSKPGVYVMSRRLSVYEALSEAGGVLPTGDKKKVVVLHWNADRVLQPIPVDVAAIEKGRAADSYFLRPGDQIFVPGNKWKRVNQVLGLLPIISFARIFTGGF